MSTIARLPFSRGLQRALGLSIALGLGLWGTALAGGCSKGSSLPGDANAPDASRADTAVAPTDAAGATSDVAAAVDVAATSDLATSDLATSDLAGPADASDAAAPTDVLAAVDGGGDARLATLALETPLVSGGAVSSFALAARKDDVLLAAIERVPNATSGDSLSFTLRSLRWDGSPLGATLGLAQAALPTTGTIRIASPTVATDGTKILACWENGGRVDCFVAEGAAGQLAFRPGPSLPGVSSAVAWGPQGWAIATVAPLGGDPSSASQTCVVQRLSEGFGLRDSPRFERVVMSSADYFLIGPRLVGTDSGFALLSPGQKVNVDRLDADLSPTAATVVLDQLWWGFASFATRGSSLMVALSKPYGVNLYLIDQTGSVTTTPYDAGVKLGAAVALASTGEGFAASWVPDDGTPLVLPHVEVGAARQLSRLPTGSELVDLALVARGTDALVVTGRPFASWGFR